MVCPRVNKVRLFFSICYFLMMCHAWPLFNATYMLHTKRVSYLDTRNVSTLHIYDNWTKSDRLELIFRTFRVPEHCLKFHNLVLILRRTNYAAQWIRLCLPVCSPGFKFQANHRAFSDFNFCIGLLKCTLIVKWSKISNQTNFGQ